MVAGLLASGSAVHTPIQSGTRTAAAPPAASIDGTDADAIGLVPAAPEPPRKLRALGPAQGVPLFGGTVPLHDISLPGGGALGIPEIVLAAYRNAELALQSSMPNCGITWHLLAGIGKVESNHAAGGRTDANGTTIGVIYGPPLDGTLPGNEVIQAADGSFVRAIGPMQFLPGTWAHYASDGRGDGHPDPNNVFDAALAAGKYLCAGGLDLRDPQQQLRAVLRYNNSLSYAAQVLSWSNAYATGGMPTQVPISPDLIPPGSQPTAPDILAANSSIPTTDPSTTTNRPPATIPAPTQVMIIIPGLPPIPCGIFCPPPRPNPCDPAAVPAPPDPGDPELGTRRWSPGGPVTTTDIPAATAGPQTPDAAKPGAAAGLPGQAADPAAPADPNAPQQPATCAQPGQQPGAAPGAADVPPPAPNPQAADAQPSKTPEPGPMSPDTPDQPAAPATPPPPPGITLPFGIVIPLPGQP
ncbi:lytic transglycosylase domain-containing protein [Nocardia sp. alder85J]|uniref:lytic transglycosylase domain-containing protein n=1 Tax=Nocardia sp. alder85J TaxID=2862949 RepID=UPI001CD3AB1B|nr:lytic murein transglycosylase [Nocardia sp. alder85J]MCX4096026.1 lytic murein transglycosylase [Nocardia sp. alder85J]